jgi:uncharacterized Zn-finger protein
MILTQQADTLESATSGKLVELSRSELPLACPMPGQELWNSHPRVFLPIEDDGEAACPYCGTRYTLKDA